ncbi:MAG: glycosyltransferase [Acidobacteriia bacterium]|nr:glycosyltransferase [Terriglobia bacterium]
MLQVFGQMNRGGAELRTLEIMRRTNRSEFQLKFCVLSGLAGDLDDEIRALGGSVHRCRLGPLFPLRFRHLIAREGVDVVQSHVHYFSGYVLALAKRAGVPVRIAHFRSTTDGQPDTLRRRIQRKWMRRLIERDATHVLANGKAVMEAAWGPDWGSDGRREIVFNGLDPAPYAATPDKDGLRRELRIPDNARVVIHVGRLDRPKNHTRLVRIFLELSRLEGNTWLLLVGRGGNQLEEVIHRDVTRLGLQSKVLFLGLRSDVPRLMLGSDLMIFPSTWEGLPGVLLEACAADLPVLASDIAPNREVADFFESVRLLPLAASDAEWASVAAALSKEARRSRDGPEAILRSPFSIRVCAEAHRTVWQGRSPDALRDIYRRFDPVSGTSLGDSATSSRWTEPS